MVAVLLLVNRGGGDESSASNVDAVTGQDYAVSYTRVSDADINEKQDLTRPEIPAESTVKEKPKQVEPAKKIEVIEDETDLDDIFDSVTELFEEKEGGK